MSTNARKCLHTRANVPREGGRHAGVFTHVHTQLYTRAQGAHAFTQPLTRTPFDSFVQVLYLDLGDMGWSSAGERWPLLWGEAGSRQPRVENGSEVIPRDSQLQAVWLGRVRSMLPRKLHSSRLLFICLTLTIVYDTHQSPAASPPNSYTKHLAWLSSLLPAGAGPNTPQNSLWWTLGSLWVPGAASLSTGREQEGCWSLGGRPAGSLHPLQPPGLGGPGVGPERLPTLVLSPLQRSPRSAATRVTSSSHPSWTCDATRSTRAAQWGPHYMRASLRSSSLRAWAVAAVTGRPTSARTASGCSPPSTGAAPPPPASLTPQGHHGQLGHLALGAQGEP